MSPGRAPCVSLATYPSRVNCELVPLRLLASCVTSFRTSSCAGELSLLIRFEL